MFPEMLTGVPSGTSAVLDLTSTFTPLLLGLYLLLGVCLGGLLLSSLYPHTGGPQRRTTPVPDSGATGLELTNAA
jgi:hypothetical protein